MACVSLVALAHRRRCQLLSIARRVPQGLQQYRNGGNGASRLIASTSVPRSLYCTNEEDNETATCGYTGMHNMPRK